MTVRTVAIGFDAGHLPLIEQWADHLPNLTRLLGEHTLRTANPRYVDGQVWEAFVRGGPHRPGPTSCDPDRYRAVEWQAGDEPAFWRDTGLEVVAFDVPWLTPGRLGDSDTAVLGWGTIAAGHVPASQPPGLLDEVTTRFGPCAITDEPSMDPSAGAIRRAADDAVLAIGQRRRIIQWLATTRPCDLLVAVIGETHLLGEAAWHGVDPMHPLHDARVGDALLDVYRATDALVSELEAALPDDRLVVFSVHGMAPNRGDVPGQWLLPVLLHRAQTGRWGVGTPRSRRRAATGRLGTSPARRPVLTPGTPPVVAARRAAGRILPPAIRQALGRRLVEASGYSDDSSNLHEEVHQPASWLSGSWPAMRAFALPTHADALVRLNVVGREPAGLVTEQDFLAERERWAAWVRDITDPRTGRPAVQSVRATRDAAHEGDHPADLVVRFHPHLDALEHPEVGMLGPVPFARRGTHSPVGFVHVGEPRPAWADELAGHGTLDAGKIPELLLRLHLEDPRWVP